MKDTDRAINFIKVGHKTLFEVAMNNIRIDLRNGNQVNSSLKSKYIREIYDVPTQEVGYVKYKFIDTQYKVNDNAEYMNWSFAKGLEFYNGVYNVDKYSDLKAQIKYGGNKRIPFPSVEEVFKKYPKLPSVYLLTMQVYDIITFDSYLSSFNSNKDEFTERHKFIKVDDLSSCRVEIGANQYSKDSYFQNNIFYVKLEGQSIYNNIPILIYDYYCDPSEVYIKKEELEKSKKNKSLFSGKLYVSIDDGDLIYGELSENVVPIDGSSFFTQRKIIVENKGDL